jgi:hypothetical protein
MVTNKAVHYSYMSVFSDEYCFSCVNERRTGNHYVLDEI